MDNVFLILIIVLLVATILIALPFVLIYIKDNKKCASKLCNCAISHELEFGGVVVDIAIKDFNNLGFDYGDSVNILFSNGYTYRDIPYYNGYYTDTGKPLLLGYPGSKNIKIAISNGDDLWNIASLETKHFIGENNMLWELAKLNESTTVTITLFKKGKYLDIQKARDIHYYDDRELYTTDEVYANFRSLKGGKLKENYFFRSASPCDNQHKRAPFVDKLIKKAKINYIINLADNDAKIKSYTLKADYNSPYFNEIYIKNTKQSHISPLALNMNYGSKYFKQQTIKALIAIAEHNGPFLIHCTEGKDRTGFVCMLIEMLAEASYEEIVTDYMITYNNYYSISQTSDTNKYNVIVNSVLNPMIKSVIGKKYINIKNANFAHYAKKYLLKNGMTAEQVVALEKAIICEK